MKDMEQLVTQQQASKRPVQFINDSDEEESNRTKTMDIFKLRQHKKLSKN